jgi:hypothetical protein
MIQFVHPGSGIPDPDADFLSIPDPGVKKAPDPIIKYLWSMVEFWLDLVLEISGLVSRSSLLADDVLSLGALV